MKEISFSFKYPLPFPVYPYLFFLSYSNKCNFSLVEGHIKAISGERALYEPQGVFFINIGLISDLSLLI
jgi:hypothetical protein